VLGVTPAGTGAQYESESFDDVIEDDVAGDEDFTSSRDMTSADVVVTGMQETVEKLESTQCKLFTLCL